MLMRRLARFVLSAMAIGGFVGSIADGTSSLAAEGDPDGLTGQWYGTWCNYVTGASANLEVYLHEVYGYAIINAPEGGFFFQPLGAEFAPNSITITAGDLRFEGAVWEGSISGWVWNGQYPIAEWQIYRRLALPALPGLAPGPNCTDGLSPYCVGDSGYCTELLRFDPDEGTGYVNYPVNGETWEDQYRSYARRDLIQLVKHAAAQVECKTRDWGYWGYQPVGLADMSEANGSIPGTSIGYPGHPAGSHENGSDMDVAYYQLYSNDNFHRPVCRHYDGFSEAYRCVEEPYAVDIWRTALFISFLAEHPHLRLIGVDGQIGLRLEEALDRLVQLGWLTAAKRDSIPLGYEVTDTGRGLYQFHHHHMHISMAEIQDILSNVQLAPENLSAKSNGRFITAYIEFIEGYDPNDVEISTVSLLATGSVVPIPVEWATVSDFNGNGTLDLTLKFDRKSVIDAVGDGTVEVAISGAIDGAIFMGSDTVRVLK